MHYVIFHEFLPDNTIFGYCTISTFFLEQPSHDYELFRPAPSAPYGVKQKPLPPLPVQHRQSPDGKDESQFKRWKRKAPLPPEVLPQIDVPHESDEEKEDPVKPSVAFSDLFAKFETKGTSQPDRRRSVAELSTNDFNRKVSTYNPVMSSEPVKAEPEPEKKKVHIRFVY